MFFKSPSKKELRAVIALDQIGALITLRVCLALIREGKVEAAVSSMEHALDCGITSVLSQIQGCDAVTKDLMAQELRRLWLYRKDVTGYSRADLERLEPDLRDAMLRMRTEVEKVLEQYKT
jgi:hypothetical protein